MLIRRMKKMRLATILVSITGHFFQAMAQESFSCRDGRVVPRLFIIGAQKGGTSSLYAELASMSKGRLASSSCSTTQNDQKECNGFSTHTTLATMYLEYGEAFCRPGSTTANYCKRLRARKYQARSFFFNQYDPCVIDNAATTAVAAATEGSCRNRVAYNATTGIGGHCAPLIPIDASPTYVTRPHVPGTLKTVFGGRAASSLRFVLSLRDPVTRTVSYFNHAVTNNWANLRRRQRRELNFSFGLWVQEEIDRLNTCVVAAAGNLNLTMTSQSETIMEGKSILGDHHSINGNVVKSSSGSSSSNHRTLKSESSALHHSYNDDDPAVYGFSSSGGGDDPVRPGPLSSRPLQPWPDCGILGLSAGLYSLQLQHWLTHFKPAQYLVVSFEALRGESNRMTGSSSSSSSSSHVSTRTGGGTTTAAKGSSATTTSLLASANSKHLATETPRDLHRALLEHIVRFAAGSNSHQAAAVRALFKAAASTAATTTTAKNEESDSSSAATAAVSESPKARRVASFSHFAHDRATSEDLTALQQYFAPFNRQLVNLLERERIQIAPDGLSAFDLVANWGH